jgi:GNAT superfamily N-acetyltransferase
MIRTISYEQIFEIWSYYLWADRKSPIEPISAMLYKSGYDLKNFQYSPTFFAYYVDNKIAGVNSGHRCDDGSYRSRGLYVFSEYRKQGLGTQLLLATIEQGKLEECSFVWSYPRITSWGTYERAGFYLTSDWADGEVYQNAFCKRDL